MRASIPIPMSRPGSTSTGEVPSDESLLVGMGLGQPGASRAFVHRFQRRVYGLARTIVGDPAQADDIAQEAMVRAWRHADSYDSSRGSVASWVLTITRNLSIDSLRRHNSEPVDPETLLMLLGPASEPPLDEAIVSHDHAGQIRDAVAQLPLPQRRAVVLASLQGRTAREISAIEAIPLGTAKTRIRTGLLRLRAMMAPRLAEERASLAGCPATS